MATAFATPTGTPPDIQDFAKALEVPLGLRPPPTLGDRVPDEDEAKLAQLARRLCDDASNRMWPFRRKWRLNEEWRNGNFATWNYVRNSVQEKPGAQFAPLGVHLNIMRPTANTWIAKMLSAKPQPLVLPGSTDSDVIDAAKIAQRIASEWQWHVQGMEYARAAFIDGLEIKGTAVFKLTWNPRAGKQLAPSPRLVRDANGNPRPQMTLDPATGFPAPMRDEMGAPVFETERDPTTGQPIMDPAWEGQNELCVIDVEDMLVDMTATSPKDAMWMAHVSEQHVARIGNTFRDKEGKPIRVRPGAESSRRDTSGWWGSDPSNRSRTFDYSASATVREVWIRKGTYPFGSGPNDVYTLDRDYQIVECDGKTLAHGPNIYEHERFPFIFGIMPGKSPKQFWGETRFSDVRGIQATILKTAKQVTDAQDLMGNPRITFGAGAQIIDADRSSKSGIWIKCAALAQPHEMPHVLEGVTCPPGVYRWLDSMFKEWLPFISGNHMGGMGGGAPPNVEAAAAFIQLESVDADQLTPDSIAYWLATQEWLEMTMSNCKQFMSLPRLVQVAGKNKEPEVVAFSSALIHDSFIYQILPSSTIPQAKAAQFQKAVSLFMQRDANGRPVISRSDLRRRVGEEPNEEPTTEEIQAEAAKRDIFDARTRGAFMTPDVVMNFVDPEVYLEVFTRYLLETRPESEPQAYQMILGRAVGLTMMMEQRAAAMAPPPPGGKGAPPNDKNQKTVAASGRPDHPLPPDQGIPDGDQETMA